MNSNGDSAGVNFSDLLTLVFIVLKLCRVITWSWVWVLSPLWIGAIIWLLAMVISVFMAKKK